MVWGNIDGLLKKMGWLRHVVRLVIERCYKLKDDPDNCEVRAYMTEEDGIKFNNQTHCPRCYHLPERSDQKEKE